MSGDILCKEGHVLIGPTAVGCSSRGGVVVSSDSGEGACQGRFGQEHVDVKVLASFCATLTGACVICYDVIVVRVSECIY